MVTSKVLWRGGRGGRFKRVLCRPVLFGYASPQSFQRKQMHQCSETAHQKQIKEICAVDKWPSQGSDKFSEANTPFVVWPNLERGTAGHSRGTFGGFGGSEPLDSSRVRLHGVNLSPGKDVVQLLFSGVICYSRKHQTEHYVNTAVTMLLFSKIPQRFSK
ncbi:hypothetical protein DNTS_004660 [Danionella cerebrum]|uniref:Uncharacterized protein n=1 Tax=Danionella cerebrum TaxID=2873325 RepID=A0A553QYG3_9TELE|nr:hypothetical protein DNTS_004660 [Danionella translucida]